MLVLAWIHSSDAACLHWHGSDTAWIHGHGHGSDTAWIMAQIPRTFTGTGMAQMPYGFMGMDHGSDAACLHWHGSDAVCLHGHGHGSDDCWYWHGHGFIAQIPCGFMGMDHGSDAAYLHWHGSWIRYLVPTSSDAAWIMAQIPHAFTGMVMDQMIVGTGMDS